MSKKFYRRPAGISLIEAVIGTAMLAVVALMISSILSNSGILTRQNSLKQQLLGEGQACMNTMMTLLRRAQPKSIVICSCASGCGACGVPPPGSLPNSRVEFVLSDNTPGDLYYQNQTVYLQNNGGAPQKLASHVFSLSFTGDPTNPTLLMLSLELRADSRPGKTESVQLFNQAVRLGS